MCKFTLSTCAAAILFASGCSTPLPPAANPEQARSAVEMVLEAWKRGEKLDSLQARTPPIHVNDPEWSAGAKLLKFEIVSDHANGQSRRCEVLLTVQGDKSAPKKQQASYTIDTEPALVVVRD
jgi:hypothetical protein